MTRILTLLLCGLVLASCSPVTGSSPLPVDSAIGAPARQPEAGTGYDLLYSFAGGSDAAFPVAGLTNVSGELYGTAGGGGTSRNCSDAGCGTVFEISTSGSESLLYRFKNSPDGAIPLAGMIVLNGVLYGTTSKGGGTTTSCAAGCGTVFDVDTSGKEHVLYAFQGGTGDGAAPSASLAAINGTLYGTTLLGGPTSTECPKGCGTVFSISASGTEQVLHTFAASPDGIRPEAGLLAVGGKLYGTTYGGGTNNFGTVFDISASGHEKVLYRFSGGLDGAYPRAGLIETNGKLYGTTEAGGGKKSACSCGTVFEISPSGVEHVVYRFKGGKDGESPYAPVAVLNHKLYGTTAAGGIYGSGCGGGFRCGTVFEVTESGTERVLHRFSGYPDGAYPYAGLLDVSGTLYGTTSQGGSTVSGCCGTVFKFTP